MMNQSKENVMSEDNQMCQILMIAACFAVACVAGCSGYVNHVDDATMAEMVRAGANPIAARCAVRDVSSAACSIHAAKN